MPGARHLDQLGTRAGPADAEPTRPAPRAPSRWCWRAPLAVGQEHRDGDAGRVVRPARVVGRTSSPTSATALGLAARPASRWQSLPALVPDHAPHEGGRPPPPDRLGRKPHGASLPAVLRRPPRLPRASAARRPPPLGPGAGAAARRPARCRRPRCDRTRPPPGRRAPRPGRRPAPSMPNGPPTGSRPAVPAPVVGDDPVVVRQAASHPRMPLARSMRSVDEDDQRRARRRPRPLRGRDGGRVAWAARPSADAHDPQHVRGAVRPASGAPASTATTSPTPDVPGPRPRPRWRTTPARRSSRRCPPPSGSPPT